MGKKFISLSLIILMFMMCMPMTAFGAQSSLPTTTVNTQNDQKHANAVTVLGKYLLKNDDGTLSLNNVPDSTIKKIGKENYLSVSAGLDQTNKMVKDGYLKFDSNYNAVVTTKYLDTVKASVSTINESLETTKKASATTNGNTVTIASIEGINHVFWYWWGFTLYLDSANANRVSSGLWMGAVIATLIPEPTLSKAVSVLLGLSAAIVGWVNAPGRGIVVEFDYTIPTPPLLLPICIGALYSQ